jgi:hypothetical protein
MKRVNPNPMHIGNDEAGETVVQHIAEDSNKTKEIITEAWLKYWQNRVTRAGYSNL